MELDARTVRIIKQLTGKNVLDYDRVSSLREIPLSTLDIARKLARIHGGMIPAIQFLRYMSKCTLTEAVQFLNGTQIANGE
jgi:hypothetical protein